MYYTPAVWVHSRAASAEWLVPRKPVSELLSPIGSGGSFAGHTVSPKSLDRFCLVN